MRWERINKLFLNRKFLIGLFVVLFFLTRLPYLGRDAINPDGYNWHYRSEQFMVGLKNRVWDRTYQHYHPGVTLMWIMGPTVEVARQINPEFRVYNHINFLYLHTLSKYALIFTQFILTLGVLYVFSKILGFKTAYLSVLLFNLEPFFIGNSRMLHMDVLLALFLALGLGFAYLGLFKKEKTQRNLILSGIFIALSFLTKSVAIGAVLFVLGMVVFANIKNREQILPQLAIVFFSFIASVVLFFPAMWTEPVRSISRIFDEAERVGIRKGHSQVYFGEVTRDPGLFFYPVVLFLKSSPVLIFGILTFFGSLLYKNWGKKISRKREFSFLGFLTIFFAGYFLVMTISSKKIDRYLIPAIPYFSLMAVLVVENLKKVRKDIIIVGGFLLVLLCDFFAHPYGFAYSTPLVGSAENAHRIVAQKPFGIGIPDLKELILNKYGDYPSLGFYDIKPMQAIYKASQISDVEVYGPSDYEYLILGPNEVMPEKVLESDYQFILDETVYINGLEYWRIYAKVSEEK